MKKTTKTQPQTQGITTETKAMNTKYNNKTTKDNNKTRNTSYLCDLKAGSNVLNTCRMWISSLEKDTYPSASLHTQVIRCILGRVHLGFHDDSCSTCAPLLQWSFSLA